MREKNLYIEHFDSDKFRGARKVSPKHRHFVLGSSRVADMRLLGKKIGGVQAVLEYRKPFWFLVNCGEENDIYMNHDPVSEMKINGGERFQIGDHEILLHLTDPQRPLYSIEESVQDLNTQQVLVICNGEIEETHFLKLDESFSYAYGDEIHELSAPEGKDWQVTQFGRYIIRQRLTHKPKDSERPKPSLKLIQGEDVKIAGSSLFVFLFLLVSVSILKPKDEKKDSNKFVNMIYDAKMMQELRKEAEEVSQKRFVASEIKEESTEKTPEKEYVAKVVKNIRAKGLSKLIGRIAMRAQQDALTIEMLNTNDESTAQKKLSATTSAELFGEKMKVSEKKFKVRKLSSVGDLSGEAKKAGAKLSRGSVATGNVGIVEEEIVLDGGLDREVIASYIKTKLGEIRYCYERQLSGNQDLHGKVMIKFVIGSTGKVTTQRVSDTTLKNAIVEGCILRRVATWKFPTPKGGAEVAVSYPFLFKSIN